MKLSNEKNQKAKKFCIRNNYFADEFDNKKRKILNYKLNKSIFEFHEEKKKEINKSPNKKIILKLQNLINIKNNSVKTNENNYSKNYNKSFDETSKKKNYTENDIFINNDKIFNNYHSFHLQTEENSKYYIKHNEKNPKFFLSVFEVNSAEKKEIEIKKKQKINFEINKVKEGLRLFSEKRKLINVISNNKTIKENKINIKSKYQKLDDIFKKYRIMYLKNPDLILKNKEKLCFNKIKIKI